MLAVSDVAGEEALTVLTKLAKAAELAVVAKSFQPTELSAGIVQEVPVAIAARKARIAFRYLVRIVSPGKAARKLAVCHPPGRPDKAKASQHTTNEHEFGDQ